MFSIYFNICNIVLKDGWDIDLLFNMSVMVLKCPQGVIGPCAGTRIGLEERMIGVGGSGVPQGTCPWKRHCRNIVSTGEFGWFRDRDSTYINKQVFPHAPSPTMTSLRRISAMAAAAEMIR